MFWLSRLLPSAVTTADLFAKCATAVAKRYSLALDAGEPLVAKTSWARFVPTDMPRPEPFAGLVPMTADLGGEVHEVPYDPAVLTLPDHERRQAVLDWLHGNLLGLAAALYWHTGPLDAAYEACLRDGCRFQQQGTPKANPNRRYRAHVEFEIDGNGDGWSWAVITDRAGTVVATSDRRDSPASITSSGRIRRSLHWQGAEATWIPWIEVNDLAPKGYEWWLGHVERLPAPTS